MEKKGLLDPLGEHFGHFELPFKGKNHQIEADNMMSIYAHVNVGSAGYYGLVGYQEVDVSTSETLPNSTYGDVSLDGIKYGLGYKTDNFRFELVHSDFDDVSLSSTSGSSTVTADVDATYFNIGYNF